MTSRWYRLVHDDVSGGCEQRRFVFNHRILHVRCSCCTIGKTPLNKQARNLYWNGITCCYDVGNEKSFSNWIKGKACSPQFSPVWCPTHAVRRHVKLQIVHSLVFQSNLIQLTVILSLTCCRSSDLTDTTAIVGGPKRLPACLLFRQSNQLAGQWLTDCQHFGESQC